MADDRTTTLWTNLLVKLYPVPPGTSARLGDPVPEHLAAAFFLVAMDVDVYDEVYANNGFNIEPLFARYPELDRNVITAELLEPLRTRRYAMAAAAGAWRALARDYEGGPCPGRTSMGHLVTFTKTFPPI